MSTGKPIRLGWILAAMALGVVLGLLVGDDGRLLGLPLVGLGSFLGNAFLNLLRMLVVPLVVASIISGVAVTGNARDLGRLGLLSVTFYVLTTLIAVLIALTVVNAVAPGIIDGVPARELLALHMDAGAVNASVQANANRSLGDILLAMIPVNIVAAAAEGKLIGLLLFSLLFGYFVTQLQTPARETTTRFWDGMAGVMMRMTGFVMQLAPLGVLGLTLKV
ncbi:MAG TPA: cation:dicarboxylase symporter family transporter, partial [Steroidobacteraceae bacterium]|nr:cation:dicarboxylase symporter family transporter [Steroidobacteraceae bacterium]